MEVRIVLDQRYPPAGRLHRLTPEDRASGQDGSDSVEFVGWLGLLHALHELIEPVGEEPEPRTPTS